LLEFLARVGNVAERGPLAIVRGPPPTFSKKLRNESSSGCVFLYILKPGITGKQQSKNFRKTQKTTAH